MNKKQYTLAQLVIACLVAALTGILTTNWLLASCGSSSPNASTGTALPTVVPPAVFAPPGVNSLWVDAQGRITRWTDLSGEVLFQEGFSKEDTEVPMVSQRPIEGDIPTTVPVYIPVTVEGAPTELQLAMGWAPLTPIPIDETTAPTIVDGPEGYARLYNALLAGPTSAADLAEHSASALVDSYLAEAMARLTLTTTDVTVVSALADGECVAEVTVALTEEGRQSVIEDTQQQLGPLTTFLELRMLQESTSLEVPVTTGTCSATTV